MMRFFSLFLLGIPLLVHCTESQSGPSFPMTGVESPRQGPSQAKAPLDKAEPTENVVKLSADAPTVTVHPAAGKPVSFKVEVARTEAGRAKGLMFRTALPPDHGMLFLMDRVANHRFWMKNTLIPLDMVFIAPDGEIVGIVRNAEPRTLQGREVGRASLFVLEIGGGEAEIRGIQPGDWVDVSGVLHGQ